MQHSGGIPVTIKRAFALFLAAAMVFSFTACHKGKAKNAGKTINYNLTSEPTTLDPQIASDTSSLTVIQALFEGLTRLDANEKPQPGVAESWEHNADSTQFTFHLRKDAKWSNKKYGSSVTASDFVFAFQRALDPKTGSSTCTQMYCIKNAKKIRSGKLPVSQLGVTAKNANTLVVDLEYSCPDLPKLTAAAVFMPCNKSFFNYTAGRYGLETEYLLGNGPFCIDGTYGWEHGKYLNLAKSDTYAGKSSPLPAAVDFSIGTSSVDLSDPAAALTKQTIDAAQIPASRIDTARSLGCTFAFVQDTTWGLCFNTQSSLFKNENVRRAFVQAFSRSAVLSHLPKGTAAENIILPGTTLDGQIYRTLAGGPFYLKQSAKASQLLHDGLKELNLSEIGSVTVLCPDDTTIKMMVNEMIAAWNQQFSSYFNMKPMSLSSLEGRVQSGDYDIVVYPVKPANDGPYSVLSMFLSGASSNPAGLKDSSYDALVSSAQTENGRTAATAYAAAEKYLNEKAVFYPLYYEKSTYALAKGVTGVIFHPYGGGVDFINAGKE
jgi:oligopeptide transport system substrate-binding protein